MIDLTAFAAPIARLFREEKLDDIDRLVATRSWDEYPTVSRLARIAFLAELTPIEQSYVLFAFALPIAERVAQAACTTHQGERTDFVSFITIKDWSNLEDDEPTPAQPNIFVCTKARSLMKPVHIMGLHSPEARIVADWLDRLGVSDRWDIAQSRVDADSDPDLFTIYVGLREPPCPGLPTLAGMLPNPTLK